MQHLTLATKATAITDEGVFSAIAATYAVDRVGDQIIRGAFDESIKRWQGAGRSLPLHWNHRGEAANVIGSVDPTTMRETTEGLYVEGQLDLEESEVAREAWRSMKANRVALSFGYVVTADRKREDGVRELLGLDLFEISVVAAPANPDTRFLSLKAARPSVGDDEWRVLASLANGTSFTPSMKEAKVPAELVGTYLDPAGGGEVFSKKRIDHELALRRKATMRAKPIKVKTFEC